MTHLREHLLDAVACVVIGAALAIMALLAIP